MFAFEVKKVNSFFALYVDFFFDTCSQQSGYLGAMYARLNKEENKEEEVGIILKNTTISALVIGLFYLTHRKKQSVCD